MGNDSLSGGAGNDALDGGAGDGYTYSNNDTLSGGTGDDWLGGGAGDDLYTFSKGDGADYIYENDEGGTDTVQFLDVKSTEITSIEQLGITLVLKYGTTDQLMLLNTILYSRMNIEQFKFSDGIIWDRATLAAQPLTYRGTANNDSLYGFGIKNLIFGLDGNDTLEGFRGNDTLNGGTGNDSLSSRDGSDSLNGETGNDTLNGDAGNDLYTFSKGDGVDTISDFDLTAGNSDTVQFLDVKSTEITSIARLGNMGENLVLKYGADQLTIIDYFYNAYSIELLKFSDGVTWDTTDLLAQTFTITGTANNDSLGGHFQGGNIIYGLDGNDTLMGSDMADRIEGGTGDDALDGFLGNDTLNGGTGNDYLGGRTGNNVLNGGAGADTMSGSDGNDTYYVDNLGDVIWEPNTLTSGTDRVNSYLTAYTLAANIENGRILAQGTASLTGNELNNVLYAGAGNNTLDGGTGIDTASYGYASAGVTVSLSTTAAQATGGSGSDTLKSIENLAGSSYADKLTGNTNNNALSGGAGNDILNGGSGNDTLTGGLGTDKLTGGAGADSFDFNALAELGLTSATRDTITDFKTSEGDKIDLFGVDANATLAGNQAFSFLGAVSAFTGNATGQLRFDAAAHILYGSTDADTAAEFAIVLSGVSSLSAADFVL